MGAYGGVGDLAILDGDVEIDTDEDTLALEVEVLDGELVGDGHGGDYRRQTERRGPRVSTSVLYHGI